MRRWSGRSAAVVAVAVLLGGARARLVEAQRNQPIYPAYDGYVKNPDGSYILSFAYFSHNADTIAIPPGADNAFGPPPADRLQPMTFRPGHWRFQCVMLVGPEFDGKLRWTLTYAGTTTGTSQNMLQSNWNLVEGAAELRKTVDLATAPRGVCLNRPPAVRVLGLAGPEAMLTATVSEPLNLFGSVSDEGLPREGKLTAAWRQVSGPGQVTFRDGTAARTRAAFSLPGVYELELSASDSVLEERVQVRVSVR